jgi:uncharacterized Zn-binding protein involved in type VI secretion
MAAAAKLHHFCPRQMPSGSSTVPHISAGSLITPTVTNVLIGGNPAIVSGDTCICLEEPNKVQGGSSSVQINGKPAARMGDATTHGGKIDQGVPTVLIGG